ncbi:hypothetical protein SAMN02745673_04588 [Marinactinospora thermotolerans DSM 45154]|uniref:Uncharacterized protein n=1 Tax=Marinactinospora thermotolerans DSM 45154 TaxID=1122192 RepID=A0A1T4T7Q9_9ACTN|nr:hypothetical protein SAMN02745673_04588 [Marinactinospora thermotolerans DSM 45154]
MAVLRRGGFLTVQLDWDLQRSERKAGKYDESEIARQVAHE